MSKLEAIRHSLEITEEWREQGGACWLDASAVDVRHLAAILKNSGARFVTITAYELPKNAGWRMEYHWDLEGTLLGFSFTLAEKCIASIYDLCEAADWIEREVHEEYAIDFTGRVYEPLLLRAGDLLGVNLREVTA